MEAYDQLVPTEIARSVARAGCTLPGLLGAAVSGGCIRRRRRRASLELLDLGRLDGLGAEPFLECRLEPFDFAWVCGWFGLPFLCVTWSRRSSASIL